MRKLRIYGGHVLRGGAFRRAVMASQTLSTISIATGETPYAIRKFWCQTRDEREIRLARAIPNKLLVFDGRLWEVDEDRKVIFGASSKSDDPAYFLLSREACS